MGAVEPHVVGRDGAAKFSRVLRSIASNQSFDGWPDAFTYPRLCAAITDKPHLSRLRRRKQHHSYRVTHVISQS